MSRAKTAIMFALLATILTGCRDAMGPSDDAPRPSFEETQGSDN